MEVHTINGLIAASTERVLDIDELTSKQYKVLLEHIHFISVSAIDKDFKHNVRMAMTRQCVRRQPHMASPPSLKYITGAA